MSEKTKLRKQRQNTVINEKSSRQEKQLIVAKNNVEKRIQAKFPHITLTWASQWYLSNIIDRLMKKFPDEQFASCFKKSSIRPDGGILFLVAKNKSQYPILIAEKKNQGTNDLRKTEGKPKQAKGNAIERLGKNVIGLRTALLEESIFPFICFGDGCDFSEDSSIMDRVVTIAMFGEINKEHLHNRGCFNRGSFYFREEEWSTKEMEDHCYSIAEKSIFYYFSKYGEINF